MTDIKQRPMPNSLEAEKIVLGGIIKDNDLLLDVMDYLKCDDFYYTRNQEIYAVMNDMFTKDIAIEIGTMVNFMGMDKLKELGGITYLAALSDMLVTKANYKNYIHIVRDKSIRRKVISACKRAIESAYKDNIGDVINTVDYSLMNINVYDNVKTLDAEALMNLTIDEIQENYQNKGAIPGITTGFEKLDKATNGYQKGDLWTIASRPSMGKTMTVLNLISRVPSQYNVMLFELEMSSVKLGNRLICSKARIQSNRLIKGKLSDDEFLEVLEKASEIVNKDNIFVNCKSAATLTYIRSEAKKVKLRKGLDIIFVDHIGLMRSIKDYRGNKNMEISEITAGLKAIAKDLNVCVVCVSQLNRAVESRMDKHPMLSDLRDSGSIEQDSDTVISLYRDKYYNKDTEDEDIIEFDILKNRDGKTGIMRFYYNLKYQIIDEDKITEIL